MITFYFYTYVNDYNYLGNNNCFVRNSTYRKKINLFGYSFFFIANYKVFEILKRRLYMFKQHQLLSKSLYLHQTFSLKSCSKIIISKVNDLNLKLNCILKIDSRFHCIIHLYPTELH